MAVLAIFYDFVRRIFATGLEQPDLYTKLLATGLGATLGFQVIIIVAGVIGLLPLTGITLPVHLVWRKLSGRQLLAGGARLGDERSTSEDRMRVVLSFLLVTVPLPAAPKAPRRAQGIGPPRRGNPASASDGATVYLTNCSSCHQSDGNGVAGAFPPLAGNPTVTGNPVAVIAIVKNGLEGRLVVHGAAYSGIMPSWKKQLSDDQIASVITYIRSAWHNNASGVSVDEVQAIK